MRTINHFIDGKALESRSGRSGPLYDPATGQVEAEVAFADVAEVDLAVASAKDAYAGWRTTGLSKRTAPQTRLVPAPPPP